LFRFATGFDDIKDRLRQFLAETLEPVIRAPAASRLALERAEVSLRAVYDHLLECNAEFDLLAELKENPELFPADERHELEALFGWFGLDPEARLMGHSPLDLDHLTSRNAVWQRRSYLDSSQKRRRIAEAAAVRYGLLSR
jgi:hypothetical protein